MDTARNMINKAQVEPSHYRQSAYDTKGRFSCYWHQINEIIKRDPDQIIEVGVGNGFLTAYLREMGYLVKTVDFDPELSPDVVASVVDLPFEDSSFDVVACFEVLEHLPFESFPRALSELRRISRCSVLISLPDASRACQIYLKLPRLGEFKKLISVPRIRPLVHKFDGQHYWEIGKVGYTVTNIKDEMRHVGLEIVDTYRLFEYPYCRFFMTQRR